MNATVSYLIAQYIPDVFRMEPRNIGVMLRLGDETSARFFGETESGGIDGRRLRGAVGDPEAYRQWVGYWRSKLSAPNGFDSLDRNVAANYRLVTAGEVSDTGDDSIEDVANYLYSMLVSEGGLSEALGIVEAEGPANVALRQAITEEFARANILATATEKMALVPHPVRQQIPVTGSVSEPHLPSFIQQNGLLFVMESVDFTAKDKDRTKDHAGLTSYMFEDIRRKYRDDVRTIALVRGQPDDFTIASARYGMALLHKEATQVVNWLNDQDRKAFVAERHRVATAG